MAVPDSRLKLQQKLEELEVAVQGRFISLQRKPATPSFIQEKSGEIPELPPISGVQEMKKSFGARFFERFFSNTR